MNSRESGFQIRNVSRNRIIANRMTRAEGLISRAFGLLGRRPLAEGEGLWLAPCNGIHTFGLRYPIDVIVLDARMRVVRAERSVPPNRVVLPARGGFSTIELRGGSLDDDIIAIGDLLTAESPAAING